MLPNEAKTYFLAWFQDVNKEVGNMHRARLIFCVFFHFFRSVLVRSSAISSSNIRERHFLFTRD